MRPRTAAVCKRCRGASGSRSIRAIRTSSTESGTGTPRRDPNRLTACSPSESREHHLRVRVTAASREGTDKLGKALQRFSKEDPTFRVMTDPETNETLIAGMGELHLEIIRDRMFREFKVDANAGKPQIAYRETITEKAHGVGKLIKQSGGRGQYGHVEVDVRAAARGKGITVENKIVGGIIPKEYIPAVKKGVVDTLPNGVLAGFPVVDVKVTLFDGSYHEVDSNENAFKMAGSMALKDGLRMAGPVLLEPIMSVEVETPDDFMGNVVGDLSSRRGAIQGMEELAGGGKAVRAEVPLSEMFQYSTTLRSATQGRATYSMEFKHYDVVPANVQQQIVSKAKLGEEEDE